MVRRAFVDGDPARRLRAVGGPIDAPTLATR